ncbi:N-acetyltransferase [uncultured Bacteroides sp.]|uniref:GNAT family N-acetyltransferase n=1 Tax=uncultured Bacteroides sp. TaxID=162156 RepID=UPI00263598F6|nr:N-acetyltransferase [uncultured Bacteroides sp.]
MIVHIRQEQSGNLPAIFSLVETAFATMKESDHREHFLVDRLHRSDSFVPELSLVAETDDGQLVGYILLAKVGIVSGKKRTTSLAVAPLAVLPDCQNQGIGGILLKEAHKKAASLGYGTAVILGHKDYYPRFGYCRAMEHGIMFPFDVPSELCQVIELLPGALNGVHGNVQYPPAFFEE